MPEQPIEAGDRSGRIVIAKPPEPVRAFARTKLPFGGLLLVWTEPSAGHDHVETLLGHAQQIPGAILVMGADPGREITIHPTARYYARQFMHMRADGSRRARLQIIAVGSGVNIGVRFKSGVQLIQEVETVVGIKFPGVFAIEDDADDRYFTIRSLLSDRPDLLDEIECRIFSVPA